MLFRRFRAVAVFLVACPLFLPAQASDSDSSPLTFKSNVQVVLVDVVVNNAKGEPASGLKREDFKVREDGKPQKVSFFEEHSGAAVSQAKLAPLPANLYTNYRPVKTGDAVNVLLLDWLNTGPEEQAFVHEQILKYLHNVPPGTHLAVFSMARQLRMLEGFTTDPAELLAAANDKGEKTPHLSPYVQSDATKSEDQHSIEMMRLNQASEVAIATRQELQGDAVRLASDKRILLTLLELQQLARYLAAIPGRKNVIWFAGSFPIAAFPVDGPAFQYQKEFEDTAVLLTKNRVAIYPVSASGLSADAVYEAQHGGGGHQGPALMQADESRAADQVAMEELAKDSGGRAFINTNDLANAITQTVADGGRYYTLTYTPSNKESNGKYRHVEISVSGGYKLSYRRGYYAESGQKTAQAPAPPSDTLLPLMDFGLPESSQIVYTARVLPSSPPPPPGAPLAGTNSNLKPPLTRYRAEFAIAEKDVRLDPAPDGSRKGNIELMMVAYDREGKPLNLVVHRIGISMKPEEYQEFARAGLQLESEIDVPRGDVVLQTGVLDLQSSLAGTLAVPLHAGILPASAPGQAPSPTP